MTFYLAQDVNGETNFLSYNENRTGGGLQHPVGDTADNKAGQVRQAPGAHDDQVALFNSGNF